MVPYQRNPHIKGRNKLLAELPIKLCEEVPDGWSHRVALYGLGGIGKTQLPLEYVHTQKDNYKRVYWISAVSEAILLSGFQEIAQRTACASQAATLKPPDIARSVLNWLNKQESWLMVIDNLDDEAVIADYLPNVSRGRHMLITTRNQHAEDFQAEGLEVGLLDVDDAKNLLLTRSKVGEEGETSGGQTKAKEIVKELGFLPLAIEQAAAYIREALKNLSKFLRTYKENLKNHLERASKANRSYYKDSVATTWRLSFQRIEETNSDAAELLRLFAFLNPDGILTDFLEAGKDEVNGELNEILTSSYRLHEALSVLKHYSLIRRLREGKNERITMHRLVQYVIRFEMPPEKFSTMTEAVIGLCNSAFPAWTYKNAGARPQNRRYQDQVVIPLSAIQQIESCTLGNVLWRVGRYLAEDGKYQQASELLQKAVDILKRTRAIEHDDTLTAMSDLEWSYSERGLWEHATPLAEAIVEARKRNSGSEDAITLIAMAKLATTYWDQGRRDEALKLDEHVLEVRTRLWGENDINTLISMREVSLCYRHQGRPEESASLGEKALEARRRLSGNEHEDTIHAMVALGCTYRSGKT